MLHSPCGRRARGGTTRIDEGEGSDCDYGLSTLAESKPLDRGEIALTI